MEDLAQINYEMVNDALCEAEFNDDPGMAATAHIEPRPGHDQNISNSLENVAAPTNDIPYDQETQYGYGWVTLLALAAMDLSLWSSTPTSWCSCPIPGQIASHWYASCHQCHCE